MNFFPILPLPDETQKWKYFTQKFQIISQKKKKDPPVNGDNRPPFPWNYVKLGKFLYKLFFGTEFGSYSFCEGFFD